MTAQEVRPPLKGEEHKIRKNVTGSHCHESLSPTPGIFICIVDFLDAADEDTKPSQNVAVYQLTQHSSIPEVLSLQH